MKHFFFLVVAKQPNNASPSGDFSNCIGVNWISSHNSWFLASPPSSAVAELWTNKSPSPRLPRKQSEQTLSGSGSRRSLSARIDFHALRFSDPVTQMTLEMKKKKILHHMLQALFTSAVVFCNIDQLLIQITDFFFLMSWWAALLKFKSILENM